MFVPNLLILFRVGIMEMKDMMQLHGSGRMEEKHRHEEDTCVWQHSHAQHGNELSKIKLSLIK